MSIHLEKYAYVTKIAKASNVAFITPNPCQVFDQVGLDTMVCMLKKVDYIKEITANFTSIKVVFHHSKTLDRKKIIETAIPRKFKVGVNNLTKKYLMSCLTDAKIKMS
jgi:hypothetical protein